MRSGRSLRIVQIGGLAVFGIAVALTFIFTAGYQYDPHARDLVKKGVVYFEILPAKAQLFVDGKAVEDVVPREIRVVPGPHTIEVRKTGFFAWTKNVIVPEDQVLKFTEIILVPTATASNVVGTVIATQNAVLQRSQRSGFSEQGVFSVNNNLRYGVLNDFENPHAPKLYDLPYIPAGIKDIQPLNSNTLVGETFKSRVFFYVPGKKIEVSKGKEGAVQVLVADGKAFGVNADGTVWNLSPDDPATSFGVLPDRVNLVERLQKNSDYYSWLYATDKKDAQRNSIYAVTVTTHDGTQVFHQANVKSAFLDDKGITYVTDKNVITYSFDKKKIVSEYTNTLHIKWLSRIKKSFQFILVTGDNVQLCDEDLDNCHVLTTTTYGQLAASQLRDQFIADHSNTLILLDFAAPSILPEFLQNLVS